MFAEKWRDHKLKMEKRWDPIVTDDDIVLVSGDLTWTKSATKLAQDMAWLAKRKGKILLSEGNHDRWWRKEKQMQQILPENTTSIHPKWIPFADGVIAGVLGGNCPGDQYHDENAKKYWPHCLSEVKELMAKLISLKQSASPPAFSILMMHYPPFNDKGEASEMVEFIREASPSMLVYGHFHRRSEWENSWQGEHFGSHYVLSSSDARNFTPFLIGKLQDQKLQIMPSIPWTGILS